MKINKIYTLTDLIALIGLITTLSDLFEPENVP